MYIHTPKHVFLYDAYTYTFIWCIYTRGACPVENRNSNKQRWGFVLSLTETLSIMHWELLSKSPQCFSVVINRTLLLHFFQDFSKKKFVFSLTQNKEPFKQPPPSGPGYPAHLRNKKVARWSLACSYCTTPGQTAQEVGWGQNPRGKGQAAALGAGETLWAVRRLDWEEMGLGCFCLSHNFLCQQSPVCSLGSLSLGANSEHGRYTHMLACI